MSTPFELYSETFLVPAHPYRWYNEPVRDNRSASTGWRGKRTSWFRINLEHDIQLGYRTTTDKETGHVRSFKLEPFFNRLLSNLNRKPSSKVARYWFGLTYPEEQEVSFFYLDIDCKTLRDIPRYRKDLQALAKFCSQQGIDYLLTSSPGNIKDGDWFHGAYAWFKLRKPTKVCELRPKIKAFLKRIGIQVEHSCDSRNRNIRIPGQARVEVLDPHTLELVEEHDLEQAPAGPFQTFCNHWQYIRPCDVDKVIGQEPEVHEPEEEPLPKTEVQQPDIFSRPKKKTQPKRQAVSLALPSVEESRAEPNTFKRFVDRKIGSRLAWEIHRGESTFEQAIAKFKDEMVLMAPRRMDGSIDSNTCNDPVLLQYTTHRLLNWYVKTFDPSKGQLPECVRVAREEKEARDTERFSYCKHVLLSPEDLSRTGLPYKQKRHLFEFWSYARLHKGRVAAVKLYRKEDAKGKKHVPLFERKDQWDSLVQSGVLTVLKEHDKDNHQCTQYGLNPEFVRKLERVKETKELIASLVSPPQKSVYKTPQGVEAELSLEEHTKRTIQAFLDRYNSTLEESTENLDS